MSRVQCTLKELRVLAALAAGQSYDLAASSLHVAPTTIRFHATRLQRRFGVPNNAALVAVAVTFGLLAPGQWPPELSGLTEIDLPF